MSLGGDLLPVTSVMNLLRSVNNVVHDIEWFLPLFVSNIDFAFKHFSCVLMIETHDNLASTRLNEKVIENNQQSIFLATHNC